MTVDRETGLELIRNVKETLEARGVDLHGPCGAFQITARVAWVFRNHGARLIVKRPEQNHCNHGGVRYGVDVIGFTDTAGTWIDVLINAETENRPAWQEHTGMDPTLLIFPIDLDADTASPAPSSAPAPAPATMPDDERLEQLHEDLERIVAGMMGIVQTIDAAVTELQDIKKHGVRLRLR